MKSLKSAVATARGTAFNVYKNTMEAVTPAHTDSTFAKDGKLTPDEFTAAGDFLVRTYPTWSWEAGDPAKASRSLPDTQKQYLITRNVPCHQRAEAVTRAAHAPEQMLQGDEGEDWVAAEGSGLQSGTGNDDDIPTLGDDEDKREEQDDDVPDIDDLAIESEEVDEAALPPPRLDTIRRTRTYDILITYDKYHAVPKTWLVGYNEDRQPLSQKEIFQDISADYAKKTATTDTFPHTSVTAVGIHPCKHAETMRRLADMYAAGDGKQLDSEHYLVLFLKFIASVIPTVEYDYTSSAGGW